MCLGEHVLMVCRVYLIGRVQLRDLFIWWGVSCKASARDVQPVSGEWLDVKREVCVREAAYARWRIDARGVLG